MLEVRDQPLARGIDRHEVVGVHLGATPDSRHDAAVDARRVGAVHAFLVLIVGLGSEDDAVLGGQGVDRLEYFETPALDPSPSAGQGVERGLEVRDHGVVRLCDDRAFGAWRQ